MESFSSIVFLLNGVDVSADVLQNPPPRVSGMGIMNTGISDRTGDIGTMSFSLDNSATNSAGVLGYYTPGMTGGFGNNSGVAAGMKVQLYFEYDNRRRYKFFGYVDVGGVTVETGKYGQRSVSVKASNWMRIAANHQLDLMGYQLNLSYDKAIPFVLNNMASQPQNIYLNAGVENFPTVFDVTKTNTKALGELQKFAMSEFGRIYIAGDYTSGETLYGESRTYRSDHSTSVSNRGDPVPLKQSDMTDVLNLKGGGNLLLKGSGSLLLNSTQLAEFTELEISNMRISFGKHYANHVIMRTYPRTVDAAATTVLYSLPASNPITLTAGQQLPDIRGSFSDPNNPNVKVNGISMVTPVATTDYQMFANSDGTGTDLTSSLSVVADYGTADVRYTLTNTSGSTGYVTKLQARGKGVYIYDPSEKIYDRGNTAAKSVVSLDLDLPYVGTVTSLFTYVTGGNWNTLLTGVDSASELAIDSVEILANRNSKCMMAFLYIEPYKEITITETISGVDDTTPYYVNGYSFEIISGKYVKWTPVLKLFGRY